MKTICKLVLPILFAALVLCGCTGNKSNGQDNEKMKIVATGFVQYDFVKQLVGDNADIKMLIRPGNEVHTYEPTPEDLMSIAKCDIFVYNGGESDGWIENVLKNTENENMTVVRFMEFSELLAEQITEGMQETQSEEEHSHTPDSDVTDCYEGYDEHVWTSPINAIKITDGILSVLCEADEKNAESYRQNAEIFKGQLYSLDEEFRSMIQSAVRNEIVVGDRFPFLYLANEYGIDYFAAFPGCASNTEPSAATVAFLINKVMEDNLPVVFSIEFSNGKIADAVCDASGAKRLELHSCHNVTAKEFEDGETYVSLMQRNLENLRKALN